jgi:hypothetical protein
VGRNRELLCSVFLLLAGTTQGRRRVCFFTVWFGFSLREQQREEENRFMGLLLNFFSTSHGLSVSRSDSLCLSARESKGKNGKEGEQRRKKKEGDDMREGKGCTFQYIAAWMVRIAWIRNHPTAGVNTGGL